MSRPRTILVTGFEPFGGEAVNSSWEAARALEGWRCGEHLARARMLSCVYDASVNELVEAFERLKPEAVLMAGQAARRAVVCIERVARNVDKASAPDNRGVRRGGGASVSRGPEQLDATAPAAEVARAIREAGVRARVSTNAGGYVCNHLYYGALLYLAAKAPATRAVFLHLPATPAQTPPAGSGHGLSTDDATRALKAAAAALVRDWPIGRFSWRHQLRGSAPEAPSVNRSRA